MAADLAIYRSKYGKSGHRFTLTAQQRERLLDGESIHRIIDEYERQGLAAASATWAAWRRVGSKKLAPIAVDDAGAPWKL